MSPASNPAVPRRSALGTAGRSAVLVAAAGWVYGPSAHGGWIWDDSLEVSQNPVLRDPAGLGKIWFAPGGTDYFPFKTTVQWVAWRLWGDRAAAYHGLNVGLHLLGAFLFWRLLVVLARPAAAAGPAASAPCADFAWLGALLFLVHPLAVESVAWISELKNTLSLALLLGASLAYLAYDERGRRAPPYLLALLGFTLAMLSKSTVAMFPFVILLHAWWRRGRIDRRDLLSSAPFFAVSAGLGLVTIWFQSHRAIADLPLGVGGWASRLAAAGLAVAFYLVQGVVPRALLPIYPRWAVDPPSAWQFLPWLGLAAILFWLWTKRASWGRTALFGLGWFLLNLVPILGFVPFAYQRTAWVADHFAYLSLPGLLGLAAAGLGAWAARMSGVRSRLLLGAGTALALLWAAQSRGYAEVFRSNEALWTYALRGNPDAWMAQNNLGQAYFAQHRLAEAGTHFQRALELNPDDAGAHFNLGLIRLDGGRAPDAIEEFRTALRLRPAFPEAENWLGNALARAGRLNEAVEAYRSALRIESGYAQAHANLGFALIELGRPGEAVGELQRALELNPDDALAHANLGDLLAQARRPAEAIREYEAALRFGIETRQVRNNLGSLLAQAGRLPEAESQFRAALRLAPGDPEARANLEQVLSLEGGAKSEYPNK